MEDNTYRWPGNDPQPPKKPKLPNFKRMAKNSFLFHFPSAFHAVHGHTSQFIVTYIVLHFLHFVKPKKQKSNISEFTNCLYNCLLIIIDSHITM